MGDECRHALERLQLFLDRECPEEVARAVEAHLRDCPPCLDRADFERQLRLCIASRCRDRAPGDLYQRVVMRLQVTWRAEGDGSA